MSPTVSSSGLSADAAQWVADARLAVASASDADVVVCSVESLPSGPRTHQVRIAVLPDGAVPQQTSYLLRSAAVDAVIASGSEAVDPSIPIDATTSTPLERVLDLIETKPRVSIGTAVRFGRRRELWGDTHFGRDLGDALRRLGWRTQVLTHAEFGAIKPRTDDAAIWLHGLRPCPPVDVPTAAWVISHPGDFDPVQVGGWDNVFSASRQHEELGARRLHQATNTWRFRPVEPDADLAFDALFVGNSRRQKRPAVGHAQAVGIDVAVFGRKWKRVYPQLTVRGQSVSNAELPLYYSSARVVLNDHWPDMVEHDMVSNRIFDALACGAPVLSDHLASLRPLLGDHVHTFTNVEDFQTAHADILAMDDTARIQHQTEASMLMRTEHSIDQRAAELDAHLRQRL